MADEEKDADVMPRKQKGAKGGDPRETLLNEMHILHKRLSEAVDQAIQSKEAQELKRQAKRTAKAGAEAGAKAAETMGKDLSAGISYLAKELASLAERAKKTKE